MIDPSNLVNISGGLVSDPERVNDNIVKFRIGVDHAGSERNSDQNSGYFDVTYFMNNPGTNPEFVRKQLNEGNLQKGSQIQIVGRLVQERWTSPEGNRSRVVIVAEHLGYARGSARKTDNVGNDTNTATASNSNSSGYSSQTIPDVF